MKKVNSVKDITSGMLVTLRNGQKMTVVTTNVYGDVDKYRTGLALFAPGAGEDGDDSYWPLSEYRGDFKCKVATLPALIDGEIWDALHVPIPEYDIVQVWSCTCPRNAFANTTEDRELLWSDPSYKSKDWDELTDEEKDAECSKHLDCCDCPYDNKGCDDPDDEPEEEHEKGETDIASLLDEVREVCKDNPIGGLILKLFDGDLPDEYVDYVLGKSDKNPARKAHQYGDKSLAEQLYDQDKKLAAEGVSVVERDIALLAAMRSVCSDRKE